MSRFVKEINDSPIASERAEKDILGNKIDTTYQHKLTAGSNISINDVTNTISAQVPPDFSSVIPSDASSSNKLVTTNTLDARLADFGGFKEVQGTGADLHPNVPSGEENSKLIYLVRDNSATGDDKYKEWIWDSGDPEANPPVSAQWKLIGDTTMNFDGKADKVQNATSGNFASLDSNGNLTDSGKKAADFANVQSDWNQTDTSADDYIKNKPKTVLWLTYGSTYTKAQVDGWIADGYLLCVSYSSRTYKLGRATFYQDTNYYTFSDQLDYVRLTIDNSTSTWFDGTNYPTAASIGAAPSVHSHGNIASDGTDGEATHDTSRFLCGDGAWARLQLRSTLQSEANGYFRITCVAGSDCQHSSVYVFGSYNEYGYLYQVSFNYNNNQFNAAPRVRMITCNNETGLNYIPKAIKYGTGAAGTGYIFIQTNVVQRCTFLVTGNSPSSITIDTVTSTDSATSVSDGVKGHGSVHTEEYGTGTGSSTQPVYVDAGGGLIACSVKEEAKFYSASGSSVGEMDYTKRCHFIYDCHNGTTVKYIIVNPTKLIENVAYDIGGVLLNRSAAYYIGVKYTAAGSSYMVYGNRNAISLGSAVTENYNFNIKLVRMGTTIYVIGY